MEKDSSDPESAELKSRVEAIENEVQRLRRKPKDAWHKVQVLSSLLIPLAIGFTGVYFSRVSKEAEIKVAITNAQVAQAQLVHSFIDDFSSPEPWIRKLAVEAARIALPPEMVIKLVRIVNENDPDAGVRSFAKGRARVGDVARYLERYKDFDSSLATLDGARRMLMDARLSRISEGADYVTAQVDDEFSITIWVQSHEKKNVYGVRYGTNDPDWNWEETYFEVVIPVRRK